MLVIDDLTVRIAGRTLLEGASVRIPTGARVGLVGRNGTGKTTLFGVIAGDTANTAASRCRRAGVSAASRRKHRAGRTS
jgi:ATP-binding cassette subfamily F protein 3